MEPANSIGETILIVDDDPTMREVITAILSKYNYQVIEAQNGLECIEMAKEGKADLIVMDVDMPQMDGIKACKILKSDPATKDIPVIFVTGFHDDDTLKVAFESGGADYVCKPITRIELLSRIKSVLEHQKLNKIRFEREKLVGVLEMAGAVCHELNQPLQALSVDLNIMTDALPGDSKISPYAEAARQHINQIGGITKRLMNITKYETREYIRGQKIIDIKASSEISHNEQMPDRRSGKDRRLKSRMAK
jgi:CheY-like chemotaxis protein